MVDDPDPYGQPELASRRPTRRGWLVEGSVQGVGFRGSTVGKARQLELSGLVFNRPDGAVEVHARGPAARLDQLADWLEHGPALAEVEALHPLRPRADLPESFDILM